MKCERLEGMRNHQCPMAAKDDLTHCAGCQNIQCPWCVHYNLDFAIDGEVWRNDPRVLEAQERWRERGIGYPTPEQLLNPDAPGESIEQFTKPVLVPGKRRIQKRGVC